MVFDHVCTQPAGRFCQYEVLLECFLRQPILSLMLGYFAKCFSGPNIWGLLQRCFTPIESTPSLSAVFLPKNGSQLPGTTRNSAWIGSWPLTCMGADTSWWHMIGEEALVEPYVKEVLAYVKRKILNVFIGWFVVSWCFTTILHMPDRRQS